jgi:steroid 5-alpha reductase family enzyme
MPGDTEGLWYSFNMGPVHFISVSTEVYYFLEYGLKLVTKQYEWLDKDLKVCVGNLSLHFFFVFYSLAKNCMLKQLKSIYTIRIEYLP